VTRFNYDAWRIKVVNLQHYCEKLKVSLESKVFEQTQYKKISQNNTILSGQILHVLVIWKLASLSIILDEQNGGK